MIVFTYHVDSGHGWIESETWRMVALGIVDDISEYSYMSNDGMTVYLEEDCDATVFINALKAHDIEFEIKESYVDGRHPLRDEHTFYQADWIKAYATRNIRN